MPASLAYAAGVLATYLRWSACGGRAGVRLVALAVGIAGLFDPAVGMIQFVSSTASSSRCAFRRDGAAQEFPGLVVVGVAKGHVIAADCT
jgi:hypothetical protein